MVHIDFSDLKKLETRWLGASEYETALDNQVRFADLVRTGNDGIVLACEHPTVITLGKRGQPLEDILAGLEILRAKNIKIVATDRGGQATLHNPGQLVLYPILPLRRWGLGVRDYVECLERATASYLAGYGIEVTRGYEPGLFAREMKIAAFGIRIDRGVSLHGVAINLNNDLSEFSYIRQCGQSLSATSVKSEIEAMGLLTPQWNLATEAAHWTELFKAEVQAVFQEAARQVSHHMAENDAGLGARSAAELGQSLRQGESSPLRESAAQRAREKALELETSAIDFTPRDLPGSSKNPGS